MTRCQRKRTCGRSRRPSATSGVAPAALHRGDRRARFSGSRRKRSATTAPTISATSDPEHERALAGDLGGRVDALREEVAEQA